MPTICRWWKRYRQNDSRESPLCFGSVEVEKLHSIERYSHIGSTVRGQLRPECDVLDAIEAVLPAGTLSGAPKIRACQLSGELENNKRGIYGGAIGYIDFTGNMDTCIAIRIAYKKNGQVFVRSGAGIADGAIVGSAIIKLLEQYGVAALEPIGAYVKRMKDAVHGKIIGKIYG